MLRIFSFLLVFISFSALQAQNLTESQKIDQLIVYVENLPSAIFIRNGDEYSAKEAADHLRMKREKAGNKVKTAKEFIEKIASKSYFSGKNYQIRFKDGKIQDTKTVLETELKRIENKK